MDDIYHGESGGALLRIVKIVLLVALVLVASLRADDPAPPPMTEIETANMRALNLEVQRVNALYELANAAKEKADHAAADAQEHATAMKRELEAKRPGWTVDMQSGKWTQNPPPEKKK